MNFFTNVVKKGLDLINLDKKRQLMFIGECCIEIFRIIMASSFMIFTPQKCYVNSNCIHDYTQASHICSLRENLSCLSYYQNFVFWKICKNY